MANVVYVGGFGSGPETVEAVRSELGSYFDNVSAFSLSDFVNSPQTVEDAVEKSTLVTHSAGALTIDRLSKNPEEAILLNPPLPTSMPQLVIRAVVKTLRLATPGLGLHSLQDVPAVSSFSWSSLKEFVSRPQANYGQLPDISRFNAVDTAVKAASRGIRLTLVWTSGDSYFKPTDADLKKLKMAGVRAHIIDGEHDELLIRPASFLGRVFSLTSR